MNNLHLKKLSQLNLIWIQNQGFWVYSCQICQQTQFKEHEPEGFMEGGLDD